MDLTQCGEEKLGVLTRKYVKPPRKGEVLPINEFCPECVDDPVDIVYEPTAHCPYLPSPINSEQEFFDNLPPLPKVLPRGPITRLYFAYGYLDRYNLTTVFDALMAGLMLHTPEDHLAYLKEKLAKVAKIGCRNVTVETFIADNHPLVDPARLAVIRVEPADDEHWKLFRDDADYDEDWQGSSVNSNHELNQDRTQHAFREAAEVSGMMAQAASSDDNSMYDFPSCDYLPPNRQSSSGGDSSSSGGTDASVSFYNG